MSEGNILRNLNLGGVKSILENKPDSPLAELLIELNTGVMDSLKQALQDRNINTSSLGLSQSIKSIPVKVTSSTVEVAISMDFYWKFVNYGVNGTEKNHGAPNWGSSPSGELSFLDSIKKWIPQRGVSLPSQFSNYDSFAWAIMTNVKKFGKEARPFFEDVVNEELKEMMKESITKLLGRAVEINIVSPWQ